MKRFILFSLFAVFFGTLSAQTAKQATFEINKGVNAQGYTIDLPADKSDKIISDAFSSYLANYGLAKTDRSSSVKGFTNYLNRIIAPVSQSYHVSVYFKVDALKKEQTVRLSFAIFDGAEHPIPTEMMPTLEPKIYAFLNAFPSALTDYENNLKLKEMQNLLEKQKKDLDKLNKEKSKLEKELNDKATEISNKTKEVSNSDAEIVKLQNLLKK